MENSITGKGTNPTCNGIKKTSLLSYTTKE